MQSLKEIESMRTLSEYINNDFKPIDSNETIEKVQDFFVEISFSHFPVLENGVFVGCIASEDVETFEVQKKLSDYRFTLEGFFVRTSMSWLDVLEVFARNNANIVPILDETNKYIGYYEVTDIIKFFNGTPFLKEIGGIIIVEKNTNEYSMSQITQIVESNNGKLLGVFISEATNEKVQITIKITLGSINEIIQSFRRFNYEIVSEHHEDNYFNVLKERSEYLDKYLNM